MKKIVDSGSSRYIPMYFYIVGLLPKIRNVGKRFLLHILEQYGKSNKDENYSK
jgi:hypothetical protein